jgi:M6 family metalloprotease-like protein
MKNIKYTFLILFVCIAMVGKAMPAYPGLVDYKQPDGTTVKVYLLGDERMKYAETEDGYTLMNNKKGYLEYAAPDKNGDIAPCGIVAKNSANRDNKTKTRLAKIPKHIQYSKAQRTMRMKIRQIIDSEQKLQKAFPSTGTRKLICILMNFNDVSLSRTKTDFDNLFNQTGFNLEGATGSVHDYFNEASYGQLDLSVTVAGPYTAANDMAYYGKNDSQDNDTLPRALIEEAIEAADPDVNYEDFDNDNNGYVDAVYVIYAGYGEESGGGSDCIWPHAWSLSSPVICDGKSVSKYSCSPELAGNKGTNISSIGVICHEFGHVLGAPDFYDTDYSKNGDYVGTGKWDVLAGGTWNNSGKTPAHPNAFTKCYIYNWAKATTISTSQSLVLKNSNQFSNSFYRINTTTPGEFFLLENRQKIGFNSKVPGKGMLIYHVDSAYVFSHMSSNDVNNTSHQGMYIMAANSSVGNGVESAVYSINSTGCPFPGSTSNTIFSDISMPNSLSWAGQNTDKPIQNIVENAQDSTIYFDFMSSGTLVSKSRVKLKVFPNPTTNELHMHLSDYETSRNYQICDMQGRLLLSGEINGDTTVSVIMLAPNAYILKIDNFGSLIFEKK